MSLAFHGSCAVGLLLLGLWTVFGESGLLRRDALVQELEGATGELAAIERANQRLLLELAALERDPLAVERAIADEIGYARAGATLYHFVDSERVGVELEAPAPGFEPSDLPVAIEDEPSAP
jgi:cell division protein FtsB